MIEINITTLFNEFNYSYLSEAKSFIEYRNKKLLPLHTFLMKHHGKYGEPGYSFLKAKREMSKAGKLPSDNTMRKYFSELKRVFEEFIYLKSFDRTDLRSQQIIIEAFKEHTSITFFENISQKFIKRYENEPHNRERLKLLIELEQGIYYTPGINTNYGYNKSIGKTFIYTDKHQLINQLWHISELLSRQALFEDQTIAISKNHNSLSIFNQEEEKSIVAKIPIKQYLKKALAYEEPIFKLYLNIINLLIHGVEDKLFELTLHLYLNHFEDLGNVEQRIFFNKLILISNSAYKLDKPVYNKYCFDIYKHAFKNNILIENDKFDLTHLSNILVLTAFYKDSKLNKEIMSKYSSLETNLERRTFFENFNQAYILFCDKKYNKSLTILANIVKKDDKLQKIRARMLSFQITFELIYLEHHRKIVLDQSYIDKICNALYVRRPDGQEDPKEGRQDAYYYIINAINSLETSMQQNNWYSKNNTIPFINTLKFMRDILLAFNDINRTQKSVLLEKLDNISPILSKSWLKNQVEQLLC